MRFAWIPALVLAGSAIAADPADEALKKLKGEWRAVSVEEKGKGWSDKKELAEVIIEITDNELIYKRNKPVEKFRITIDSSKKPAWIDLRLLDQNVDEKKACYAIYALEDGRLKLCLGTEFTANLSSERPTEFKTGSNRPSEGRLLFVMERIKK